MRAAFQLRGLLAQVLERDVVTLVGAPDGGARIDGAGGRFAETFVSLSPVQPLPSLNPCFSGLGLPSECDQL